MAKNPQVSSLNNSVNSLILNEEKIGIVPEIKVEIKDYQNNPIKNYAQLSRDLDENKIEIFVDFFVKDRITEVEEDDMVAEYRLKDRSSKSAYLRNRKEALIKYLCEHLFVSDSLVLENDKIKNSLSEDLVCELVKVLADNDDGTKRGDILIKVRKKGVTTSRDISISMKNADFNPHFNVPRKIDEVITFSSPSKEPKPF